MPIGYLCRSCQRCMDRDEVKVCTDKKSVFYRCSGEEREKRCKESVHLKLCEDAKRAEERKMRDSLLKIGASLSKSS